MELYNKLTTNLNDLFRTKLAGSVEWRSVPGQMIKVTSSGAGYTWGLNALNELYYCPEPCTGKWTRKQTTQKGKILDITTDVNKVYILVFEIDNHLVYSSAADGSAEWADPVKAPLDSSTIVATSNDVYVDTERGIFKCKSPCTLPAWSPTVTQSIRMEGDWNRFPMTGPTQTTQKGLLVTGKMTGNRNQKIITSDFNANAHAITLTSASSRYAYGVDEYNKAQIYINGDWRTIRGLEKYDVTSVSGEIDTTAIYAVDTDARILRCEAPCESSADVKEISTAGHAPNTDGIKQLSVNPQSYQIWSLTGATGSGTGGYGIFNRLDGVSPDVENEIQPIDRTRDVSIQRIQDEYVRAQGGTEVGDELTKTRIEVNNARPRKLPEADPRLLRRSLDFESNPRKPILLLQIACGIVFAILLVLVLLPSPFSTIVSFIIACIGGAVIISFSTS
jgi:hypothetical protein